MGPIQVKNALDYEYKSFYSQDNKLLNEIPSNRRVLDDFLQEIKTEELREEEEKFVRFVKRRKIVA